MRLRASTVAAGLKARCDGAAAWSLRPTALL